MIPLPLLFPRSRRSRNPGQAFALVLVLIIVSVLALVVVGFLSSMSQERATANAFANKTRAEQSAQAGADTAMGILRDYFKAFPDSATVWEAQSTNSADGTKNEGTTLYFRAVADASGSLPDPAPNGTDPNASNADYTGGNGPNNVNAAGTDNRSVFVLPLNSSARPTLLTGRTLPASDPSSYVNLNSRRFIGDNQGWLGTPPPLPGDPPRTSPKPVWVPWVEIKQQDGVANGGTAPVIGRYAYWVEDESFRANVSYAGLGKNHQRRDNPQNYLLNPTDVDLLGLMTTIGLSKADGTQYAQNLFDIRAAYPGKIFPESRAFAHTAGLSADNINQLRYLTTSQSSGLNLTRHGTQRLNLNGLIVPNTASVQKQVDTIVKTLQFHAPNLGQRLYRIAPGTSGAAVSTGSVADPKVLNQMAVSHSPTPATMADNYARIYNYKVAANIRDYIDSDSIPTYIMDQGVVYSGGAPLLPPSGVFGDNDVWAVGKDAAPFISEAAVRFRNGTAAAPLFDFYIDYYIEFWNMSTKDVKASDLGTNAFIRVSNPTRWEVNNTVLIPAGPNGDPPAKPAYSTGANLVSDDDGVSPSDARVNFKRDYKIDISGVTFPAGQVTVITTDADWTSVIKDTEAINHIKLCPWVNGLGKSEYKGHFPPGRPAVGADIVNMVFDASLPNGGATTSSDYETDITAGCDAGYIDSLEGALPISWGGRVTIPKSSSASYPTFFGGVMRGNWTNTTTATVQGLQAASLGDPRTNNEQLAFIPPNNSSAVERTRYNPYDVSAANATLTPTASTPSTGIIPTFGLPNYRSFRPNRAENPWPDAPPLYADPSNLSTLTAGPKQAELTLTTASAFMPIANGALTSIGQLGDIFDPARLNDGSTVVGTHGGGRSFKIGQHDDRWDGDQNSASRTWAAWRLADIFSISDVMEQPGLININGINRDNGAALRAMLTGFRFQPVPPTGSSSVTQRSDDPTGDPALFALADNAADSLPKIDEMITALKERLSPAGTTPATGIWQTGTGPFWERGELSELPGFGRTPDPNKPNGTAPTTYTKNTATNPVVDISSKFTGLDLSSKVYDRGREELFRRMVEMVTTRGNVYTVYVIGQALNQGDTKRPLSTQQLKVTFRIVPKNKPSTTTGAVTDFLPGIDYNDFDPNDANKLKDRFGKPDHYEIEVLSVSSGNT